MPETPKPPLEEIVWVNCRARASCPGNQAKIIMKTKLRAGGTSIRYRCVTCNNPFYISF